MRNIAKVPVAATELPASGSRRRTSQARTSTPRGRGPVSSATSLVVLTLGLLAACAPSDTLVVQPPPVGTPPTPAQPTVVATGLNRPQGVLVTKDGTLYVSDDGSGGDTTFTAPAQGGGTQEGSFGETGRVVKVEPDGTESVAAPLLSVSLPALGPTAGGKLAVIGSDVYVANGIWNAGYSVPRPPKAAAVLKVEGGTTTEVADLFAFEEANNPDEVPASEGGIDSHAYGLTAGPDDQLYVADAGANALLKVDPETGDVSLVAALQGLIDTDTSSVPTGVTFGTDGAIYVSLLSGFPFTSGASRVVRVEDGAVSDFATGLTLLTDVELGPDDRLYAVSFGEFDAKATPPYLPNKGSIVRLDAEGKQETILSNLNYPTSIAFNTEGDAFISTNGLGVGAPATGEVVRYPQLTQ